MTIPSTWQSAQTPAPPEHSRWAASSRAATVSQCSTVRVPASANFILSADVTINAYNASVLNSFGLMVRDDIYLDTVVNDTLGDYVAAGQLQLSSASPWNCFARKNGQLISGGNASRVYKAGETVHVEIRKGPDGYTCVFGDNAPVSAGFDFPLTAVDSDRVYVGMFVSSQRILHSKM